MESSKMQDGAYRGIEEFSVEGRIGRGQFSEVYRARAKADGAAVAIKKLLFFDAADAAARAECLKEIALLQRLSHANIIGYLGSFVSDSQLHIVLELANAGDLSRLVRNFRRLRRLIDERTVWKYFAQVSAAVRHMHSNRIMHRDIKPANVFVTDGGAVKLGDLGLGRFFGRDTLAARTAVGTPYYMSPERVKEQAYGYEADVWSLGCLLYELAALRSPFYSPDLNLYALIGKIESGDYRRLPSYAYSAHLRNLVGACIRTDPAERPDADRVYRVAKEMHASAKYSSARRDEKPLNYSKAPE